MNGVTGRMGTNQHLARSITAIIKQGGIQVSPDLTLMPIPLLTGRNENKLRALAEQYGNEANYQKSIIQRSTHFIEVTCIKPFLNMTRVTLNG